MNGYELRAFRSFYGISQHYMADLLGLGANTRVSEYERLDTLPKNRLKLIRAVIDTIGKHHAYIEDTLTDSIILSVDLSDDESRREKHTMFILTESAYDRRVPHYCLDKLYSSTIEIPYTTYLNASLNAIMYLRYSMKLKVEIQWIDQ